MNNVNYFTDLFESKPDYLRLTIKIKHVLIFLSFKNDNNFLYECGFL